MPVATISCLTSSGARRQLPLDHWLTPERRVEMKDDANRWIKRLRLVRFDGVSFRERFTYRDDSLWWFTELYLHKMRQLELAVGTVLALDAALDDLAPTAFEVETGNATIRESAQAFGRARRVAITVKGALTRERDAESFSRFATWSARLSRLRPSFRRSTPSPEVAAFVHTAFWRPDGGGSPASESYIGPILTALGERLPDHGLAYVGVGPRRNFRARRWWDPLVRSRRDRRLLIPIEALASHRAIAGSLALWRRRGELADAITAGDEIREAATYRGCDLWGVLCPELIRTALLQWPWSARAMDEAGAALDVLEPRAVMTYAEAGGWGRALVLEARRRGIPSVGIQHGFIYRHWLNYLHEPDEWKPAGRDGGVPAPDRTLIFDRYAAHQLETAGAFPSEALVVTGSARLDEMAPRIAALRVTAREDVRAAHHIPPDHPFALLAAKFSEVHEALPGLFAAVAAVSSMHLVIKPHPAETADVYRPLMDGIANISLATGTELAPLLAAADGVITMNSTVAVDAMTLGIPALVIGLPNNLTPFVDAGVMLGTAPDSMAQSLQRLLYDQVFREGLLQRAAAFVDRYQMRPDGQAAKRGADAVLALAERRRSPNINRGLQQRL